MPVFPLSAFKDNYIWIIPDPSSNRFDCVDPGQAEPVLNHAQKNGQALSAILLTHHHDDHVGGVEALLKVFPNAKVYGPADDRIRTITNTVQNGQVISLGAYQYKVINTPGHTSTHISYFNADEKWLFCGDTLFSAGCGRVFDGSLSALYQSLQLYMQLPDETLIYPAHEYTLANLNFALSLEPKNKVINQYRDQIIEKKITCTLPSTLNQEKKINPFLRVEDHAIQQFAKKHDVNPANKLAVFSLIRKLKDSF